MTRRAALVVAFVAGVKLGAGVVGLVVLAARERADGSTAARLQARVADAEAQRDRAFALAEKWRHLAEPDASCAADLVQARELATECAQFGLGGSQ